MTALDRASRLAGASSGSTYPLGMTIVILVVFMIFIVVCILGCSPQTKDVIQRVRFARGGSLKAATQRDGGG
jgi:hypothetical protein